MKKIVSWMGNSLNPGVIANPCGSIGNLYKYKAFTFFNDTFVLKSNDGSIIDINETGISWNGDQG